MKILKTILAALVLAITASSCHKDGEQADATSPLKDSPVVAQQVITLNGDTIIVCDLSLLKDTIDLPLSTFVSDFELVDELSRIANVTVPNAIEEIRTAPVLHDTVCDKEDMKAVVMKFLGI